MKGQDFLADYQSYLIFSTDSKNYKIFQKFEKKFFESYLDAYEPMNFSKITLDIYTK